MRMVLRRKVTILLLALCAVGFGADGQMYEGREVVHATLIADRTAVVPGGEIRLGVLMEHAEHWHTYWKYTGDSGIPNEVEWVLPPGFAAGDLVRPLPERITDLSDMVVYAHSGKILLTTRVRVPADLAATSVKFGAKANWLACEEVCIPGAADLKLELPVAGKAEVVNQAEFDASDASAPSKEPLPRKLDWQRAADGYAIQVGGVPDGTIPQFFPVMDSSVILGHVREEKQGDGRWLIRVPVTNGDWAAKALTGVYVESMGEARVGWEVAEPIAAERIAANPSVPTGRSVDTGHGGVGVATISTKGGLGLWSALWYGVLGGFILNLMPCVLPVISLKIFGFIQQAGESRASIFRSGLAFAAGMFAWFFGLGLVLVLLKLAGHEVSWGTYLQNPWFNLVMSAVVFVFALNLLGVFEVALPARAGTAIVEVSKRGGYLGSFFQGVFATILGTSCTAPFLGAALGFAFVFAKSPWVILLMFGAIAFGMALPYVLLAANPGWLRYVPKPGGWMVRLKEIMGFLLLATLLWLLSILGSLKGVTGVIWSCGLLLGLGLACWVYGNWGRRFGGIVMSLLIALASIGGFLAGPFASADTARARDAGEPLSADGIEWRDFTPKALEQAIASGRPVFLDFTADWCLTCKFNERTVIDTAEVREAMKRNEVIPMKADWTRSDPAITALLREHGRVGVPFYLVYGAGGGEPPVALSELLTKNALIEALRRAGE